MAFVEIYSLVSTKTRNWNTPSGPSFTQLFHSTNFLNAMKRHSAANLVGQIHVIKDILFKVFQSYQEDGRVIVKGCVQWKPV